MIGKSPYVLTRLGRSILLVSSELGNVSGPMMLGSPLCSTNVFLTNVMAELSLIGRWEDAPGKTFAIGLITPITDVIEDIQQMTNREVMFPVSAHKGHWVKPTLV